MLGLTCRRHKLAALRQPGSGCCQRRRQRMRAWCAFPLHAVRHAMLLKVGIALMWVGHPYMAPHESCRGKMSRWCCHRWP